MSCLEKLKENGLLNPDYTINKLKFKKYYLRIHPDRGGDPEEFRFFRNCENIIGSGKADQVDKKIKAEKLKKKRTEYIESLLRKILGGEVTQTQILLLAGMSSFVITFFISLAVAGLSRIEIIKRARKKGYMKLVKFLEKTPFKSQRASPASSKKRSL